MILQAVREANSPTRDACNTASYNTRRPQRTGTAPTMHVTSSAVTDWRDAIRSRESPLPSIPRLAL